MNTSSSIDQNLPEIHLLQLKDQATLDTHPKTFKHSFGIFLKDSNAYGNTYFARHFEWQGICREKWFFDCIAPDMLQKLGVFITKEAHQTYIKETFPFQTITCELNTFNVKQCSFYLSFHFSVDEVLISKGYQQIVFASHDKKIIRLPEPVLQKIKQYQIDHALAL